MASVKKMSTYIFLHFNTTCLPADDDECRATELCLLAIGRRDLRYSPEQNIPALPRVINKLVLCFNPGEENQVQEKAIDISGLTNKILKRQPPFNSASVGLLQSFLGRLDDPKCFVAHNGNNFDFTVLKAELGKVGKPNLLGQIFCADSRDILRELDGLSTSIQASPAASKSSLKRHSREMEIGSKHKLKKQKTAPAILTGGATNKVHGKLPTGSLMKAQSLPGTSGLRAKSFALRDYYEEKFGIEAEQSNTAEGFCRALVQVAMGTPKFFKLVDKNAKRLGNI